MTGALVPLRETTAFPPLHFQYRLGSTLFHINELMVCFQCETVVGSVEDEPICPVCLLREEMERAIDEITRGDWDD